MIVVGCKLDLRDERQPMNMEQVMAPIMHKFREIETCIECSSASLIQVFFYFTLLNEYYHFVVPFSLHEVVTLAFSN